MSFTLVKVENMPTINQRSNSHCFSSDDDYKRRKKQSISISQNKISCQKFHDHPVFRFNFKLCFTEIGVRSDLMISQLTTIISSV